MEDISKLLQHYTSDDSDSDVSFGTSDSTTNSLRVCKEKTEERNIRKRPTRCPDPNVYNRNALLARENRRKKKLYLETMEKELEETRAECKQLCKALKKQIKLSRRLEKEKLYFKNVLINRTQIVKLMSALNEHSTKPFASSNLSRNAQKVSLSSESSYSAANRSSRSSSFEQPTLSVNSENSENDYESTKAFESTWNELLEEDFGLKNTVQSPARPEDIDEPNHTITNKQNYVSYIDDEVCKNDTVGICLHIAQGKVSLEFCPTCHWNANRTPPMQLLQNEP